MRAFTEEQLTQLVQDAEDEQARRLPLELAKCYAAEDAHTVQAHALMSLLSASHQQLHAAARTLENAMRMVAPPQEPVRAVEEPQRKRPRVLMDEQPT